MWIQTFGKGPHRVADPDIWLWGQFNMFEVAHVNFFIGGEQSLYPSWMEAMTGFVPGSATDRGRKRSSQRGLQHNDYRVPSVAENYLFTTAAYPTTIKIKQERGPYNYTP